MLTPYQKGHDVDSKLSCVSSYMWRVFALQEWYYMVFGNKGLQAKQTLHESIGTGYFSISTEKLYS